MSKLQFLNGLDYVVLGIYMLMVAGVGVYMSRFNQKTSDYFKGDGHIPWGLSTLSLFVGGFSAFMFVGAAGIAYGNGGGALIMYTLACPAYLLGYFIYGKLWRRTRLDTPMQFLTRRYSPSTTYFFTLLSIVPNILTLGIMIYTLCIFVATAFGFSDQMFNLGFVQLNGFQLVVISTGIVLLIYTTFGGLWAVIVADSLQFVVLFLITLVVLPVAYHYVGHGSIMNGISRIANEVPKGYFEVKLVGQPPVFWVVYFINVILGYNVNWHIAQRYYSVPDENDTKKMAFWCAVMSLILPLMWIMPIFATKVLYPDLNSMWPNFAKPTETAFVTLALTVLPHGVLGVMVAAMFAATMSSADTALNWLSAVVTKDVFVPITEKIKGTAPTDKVQLMVGKATIVFVGFFAVWMAVNMKQFGGAFDVYLKADSLYRSSMFIPIVLGLMFTRTPWWSGIASFGIGVLAILVGSTWANYTQGMHIGTFADLFQSIRVTIFGIEFSRYELNSTIGLGVSTIVFFVSAFFNKREGAFKTRIESFELDLKTPALSPTKQLDLRGFQAYLVTGKLTIALGVLMYIMGALTYPSGTPLNVVVGSLAIALGSATIYGVHYYQRKMKSEE